MLAGVFGHHWIAKAVLVAAAFILAGYFGREKAVSEKTAWYSTIAVLVIIFLLFALVFVS